MEYYYNEKYYEIIIVILNSVQMEGVHVPMSQGSMDDITQEGGESSSQVDHSQGDSMSTQGARAIYAREAHIVIDYTHLTDDYKDVSSSSY